jgi:oligopeptidase B
LTANPAASFAQNLKMDQQTTKEQPSSLDTNTGSNIQPPVASRRPVEHDIHGDARTDDYAWLREKENPEVLRHLEAENAYTDAILHPTEPFQEALYQEMLSRIQQTDLSVPYQLRGYSYFTKTIEGQQYPLHFRRPADGPADSVAPQTSDDSPSDFAEAKLVYPQPRKASPDDELLLDLNALAQGHTFLALDTFEISDDNQLLAYSTDTTGFRQYTLQIKDLRTGQLLPFRAERVTSAAWTADNRTLFYVVEDPVTKRSHRLYRHTLGESSADPLIYEEPDERFRIDIDRTRSGAYLILEIASHTTSEVRFLSASEPNGEFTLIAPREDNHEYYVDHHPNLGLGPALLQTDGLFLIRTNSGGRTFRLVITLVASPDRKNWHEFIENRPDVMLSGIEAFRSHLLLFERENGLPFLKILPLATSAAAGPLSDNSYRIPFNEPAYNAAPGINPEFHQTHFRYTYESFITPRSVFDFDIATRRSTLRKQQPVLGGYHPTQYSSERLHATAPDGTQIPLSLVYRNTTPRDGSAPLLLYGYGSYGISMPVNFNSNRLSLLDRGVIFAIAHIRGGGELGKPWHDAGRLQKKQNTFTDFIASAEHLIATRHTNSKKLIIEGGSAGGLLMGVVTNMRPDLFHAVISHVPFVDVLNTMLDATLPLTVGEYEEWGNPQIAKDYFYMKAYCPYTNLERKPYPAMLVKTGLNDSQVMYWEPAKYVAKLRTLKTDSNLLLFKINMGAGHGGASGRYDYLRELALTYAFLLSQLGIHS